MTHPPRQIPIAHISSSTGRVRASASIRVRLSLLVGGLLTLITIGYSLAAYYEMRATAIAATKARLTTIGGEWARFLTAGFVATSAVDGVVAKEDALRQAVIDPTPASRAAAERALQTGLPVGAQRLGVAILNSQFAEVARIGDARPAPALPSALRGDQKDRASVGATSASELRAAGDTVLYALQTPIVVDGAIRGLLVEWRRLAIQPSPDQLNRLVGGTSLHVRLANRSGSVWSDLAKPIAAPNADPSRPGVLFSYKDSSGAPAMATAVPIDGLPWSMVIESSHDELLALGRRFLDGLVVLSAVALVLGMIGAIWLGASLTRPLTGLIDSTEAVANGDYGTTTGLATREDEVGRLARSFDTMVGRLQTAFSAVTRSDERHRRLFESVPLPCWVVDRATLEILAVNEAAIERYGYSRPEFLSMTLDAIRPPEDVPRLRAAIDAMQRSFEPQGPRARWRHITKDGSIIDVEVRAHAIEYEGRAAVIAVIHDVSERQRAAESIARLEERYSRLIREAPNGVAFSSPGGRFLSVNPAFVEMLGYESQAELLAINAADLYADPDQRANLVAKMTRGEEMKREEVRLKRKDGSLITIRFTGRIVRDPATGEVYVESVSENVTEHRRMEQQFYHAQRMDAVGRLAGGIAHDFNNLLTVIINYADFLAQDPNVTDAQRDDVESIRQAAASAAVLTRQLLIFSRQQVLQPQVLQLGDLIKNTSKLLHRLIGEHIELVAALNDDMGLIKADPGQVEQVVLNLAVNARDAMPNGGRLLIEARNVSFADATMDEAALVPAGAYVMLAVSDTGIGMDRETQGRVFEPFFTTKAVGKGTGLGLATVYGIVKQSNGFLSLYSEPGQGTSFKVYFPRVESIEDTEVAPAETTAARGGSETILLVEDQPDVRRVTHRILEGLGYRVLIAASADEALGIVSEYREPIHALLTDIVLPGMNGRALAEAMTRTRAEARVLFMSGYTDDAVVRHGVLESGMPYLEKPFGPGMLAKKLRDVLDAAPVGRVRV